MKPYRKLSPNAPHPREPVPCLLVGQVTYLPDYKKPGVWHGPGRKKYTKQDLIDRFPLFCSASLWERPYVVDVRP